MEYMAMSIEHAPTIFSRGKYFAVIFHSALNRHQFPVVTDGSSRIQPKDQSQAADSQAESEVSRQQTSSGLGLGSMLIGSAGVIALGLFGLNANPRSLR